MISALFNDPILLVILLIVVVVSLSLHEYAHAFVAYKNGDWTARLQGRLTLDPTKHIDPVGFIMLMVAGFGFAKPVPVNPLNFKHIRKGIFTTAIAGVTVNFAIAFIALGFAYLFYLVIYVEFLFLLFFYFAMINSALIVFNLLPIYPLDGFRVVEAFTKRNNKYVKFMMDYGLYIFVALILLGVLADVFKSNDYAVPEWMDILGFYIRTVSFYLMWPIDKMWQLIFGSSVSIWGFMR